MAKNAEVIGFDKRAGAQIAEFGQGGFYTLPKSIISYFLKNVNGGSEFSVNP